MFVFVYSSHHLKLSYAGITTNCQIVLNTQNPCLNQATPKNSSQIFFPPPQKKKTRNRKFQTQKNPSIIPVTWNPEYRPLKSKPSWSQVYKKSLQAVNTRGFLALWRHRIVAHSETFVGKQFYPRQTWHDLEVKKWGSALLRNWKFQQFQLYNINVFATVFLKATAVLLSYSWLFIQVHRVLIPEDEIRRRVPRRSLVFFVDPDHEAVITCLDRSNKYPPITSKDWISKKLEGTYKYWYVNYGS